MTLYLPRYLFKHGRKILIALLTLIVLVLFINVFLFFMKKKIEEVSFPERVSIKNIYYLPPGKIILTQVALFPAGSLSQEPLWYVPRVKVSFSLLRAVFQRQVRISSVLVYRPQARYYQLYCFLRDNFMRIIDFFSRLPKQDVTVVVKRARLDVLEPGQTSDFLAFDTALMIKKDRLFVSGVCGENREHPVKDRSLEAVEIKQGVPLEFYFSSALSETSLSGFTLELKRENLYAQLWGSINRSQASVNGFAFLDTHFKEYEYKKSSFDVIRAIRRLLSSTGYPHKDTELPHANLNIFDIACEAKFDFPLIEMTKFNFSVNNNPMAIKGKLILTDPIQVAVHAATHLTPLGEFQVENLKRIDWNIDGTVKGTLFKGDINLALDFIKRKKGSPPLQKATIGLKECVFDGTSYPEVALDIKDINLYFLTDSNEYRIFLKKFDARLKTGDMRFKYADFNMDFYDGRLMGKATLDLVKLPPLILAEAKIEQVSANKLAGILVHFAKVYGKLDSTMTFTNYPHFDLEGSLEIGQGYLKNFEFFKWLSNFLSLESLRKVDFDRASSGFSVNEEGASLKDIDLDSQALRLGGFFNLGHNDMVTSKLSLAFSRSLLEESKKLTPLLRLFREKVERVTFDFQLSGNLHRMNFQWVQSDFKKKLEDAIPNFIERQIERSIEDFISSVSSRN